MTSEISEKSRGIRKEPSSLFLENMYVVSKSLWKKNELSDTCGCSLLCSGFNCLWRTALFSFFLEKLLPLFQLISSLAHGAKVVYSAPGPESLW